MDFDGYAIHHDLENGTMILIDEDIHKIFSHYGGHYYYKQEEKYVDC